MAKGDDDKNESEGILMPKHFVLSPVKDGNYKTHSPTVTAVFFGCPESPNPEDLITIDGGVLERVEGDSTKLNLYMFIPPAEEQLSYTETEAYAYELTSTKEMVTSFWNSVQKVNRFVFAVSSDTYYFTCKVNTQTNQVIESTCEIRTLH